MSDYRSWHFYMVRCSDGSLYTGSTLDPHKRVRVHNSGWGADYTARRRPVTLAYWEVYPTKSAARKREIEVKKWRAEKKEALLRGFPSQGTR